MTVEQKYETLCKAFVGLWKFQQQSLTTICDEPIPLLAHLDGLDPTFREDLKALHVEWHTLDDERDNPDASDIEECQDMGDWIKTPKFVP